MTHAYVLLEVSRQAYEEIHAKLLEAGYDHAVNEKGEIDMHGIAIAPDGDQDAQLGAESKR